MFRRLLIKPPSTAHRAFFITVRSLSSRSSQPVYVTHVQQLHMPRHNADKDTLEHIAHSQFHVARAIIDHPNAAVVQEDHYTDLTPKHANENRFVPLTHRLFPQGLPHKFQELTNTQKEFLAKMQGATTLFYLGKLSHIYKSASEAEAKRINSGIAIGRLDLIFEAREKLALLWAKKAAADAKKQDVLLVYGAGHDFHSCVDRLKIPSVIFKKSISTTLESEDRATATEKQPPVENKSLVLPKESYGENVEDLYQNFIPDIVKNLLDKRLTTLKELQIVYGKSPWVIEALLSEENLYNAYTRKSVSLNQLS